MTNMRYVPISVLLWPTVRSADWYFKSKTKTMICIFEDPYIQIYPSLMSTHLAWLKLTPRTDFNCQPFKMKYWREGRLPWINSFLSDTLLCLVQEKIIASFHNNELKFSLSCDVQCPEKNTCNMWMDNIEQRKYLSKVEGFQ